MRYETWVEKFRPIANPFRDNAEIDGYAFFPRGEESEFVRRQPPENVWSFIVCDGPRSSVWLIADGYHTVNLMGYLVTARPRQASKAYEVRY